MKARDTAAVGALRSALAAIDNAEAVEARPLPPTATGLPDVVESVPGHPGVAGSVAGLGAAEVRRRSLTEAEMGEIVRAEVADRESAALDYERAGRHDRAERLRHEVAVLRSHLGPPALPTA
jgi:uncharacterized protein YqeY